MVSQQHGQQGGLAAGGYPDYSGRVRESQGQQGDAEVRSRPPAACGSPCSCPLRAGKGVIRTVGSEIDRLEGELRELVPGLAYVDLETDKGAGRDPGSSVLGSMDMAGAGPDSAMDMAAMRRLYESSTGNAAKRPGV